LLGFLRISNQQFVAAILLKFRRLISERAANAFSKPEFCASSSGITIREAFPPKIFHLGENLLELFQAAADVFNRRGLGASPFG
jgi:hypothetical protein